MKYFLDTEFIEGFHKPLFGKRRHFIDLISIAIVAEDGREYYAISTEFNPKDADQWVTDNVLSKLPQQATSFYDSPRLRENCLLYKTNEQIARDIISFVNEEQVGVVGAAGTVQLTDEAVGNIRRGYLEPEFYAYYADYDWVVFCSLFGRMIDLPKGFPMYCRDLKQMLDEKYTMQDNKYEDMARLEAWLHDVKHHPNYPKQTNEHSALDDARWNHQLYQFINRLHLGFPEAGGPYTNTPS